MNHFHPLSGEMRESAKVLIITHAGELEDAYKELQISEEETYYAQRYSLRSYLQLKQYASKVGVLVLRTKRRHHHVLDNGLVALGAGVNSRFTFFDVFQKIEEFNPTHVILGCLDPVIISFLGFRRLRIMTTFANSIPQVQKSLFSHVRRVFRNGVISTFLKLPQFEWIGSYGVNSSKVLQSIGVPPSKIIPWDLLIDESFGPYKKKLAPTSNPVVCYVGSIQQEKGVGDLILAIKRLVSSGFSIRLRIVGADQHGYARQLIQANGLDSFVELMGILPNREIESFMHQCDLVAVPSWHEYPEGSPLVIHHALRACTPIVASDHPMFEGILKHGVSAYITKARSPDCLANKIKQAVEDVAVYEQISGLSLETWQALRLDVKWYDLVSRWLRGEKEDIRWLRAHSLGHITKSI